MGFCPILFNTIPFEGINRSEQGRKAREAQEERKRKRKDVLEKARAARRAFDEQSVEPAPSDSAAVPIPNLPGNHGKSKFEIDCGPLKEVVGLGNRRLQDENDDLRHQIRERDARIRHLENELKKCSPQKKRGA